MSSDPIDAARSAQQAAAAARVAGFTLLPGHVNYVDDLGLGLNTLFARMTYSSYVSPLDEARRKRLSQPLEKIPIEVGEIIGWRMWHIAANGMLKSIYNGNVWLPGETMGHNDDMGTAKIDDRGCSGVYAFRDRGYALKDTCFADLNMVAFGSVRLWGTVIEHEYGYRAEFAAVNLIDAVNVRALFDDDTRDTLLKTLRVKYKC